MQIKAKYFTMAFFRMVRLTEETESNKGSKSPCNSVSSSCALCPPKKRYTEEHREATEVH